MSRFSGKSRAGDVAKGFSGYTPSSSFGSVFSSTSNGSRLSYLFEPPDFSLVSNANVVVSLKNVLKKDSTTKARALEDLIAHVQSIQTDGGVDEAIIDVWVQLYPRTAIDNSRRVRELAHSLLIELLKSGRKRMERRIPKIVGSWLAGTYDKDRVVARAANDGLQSLLGSEEKLVQFWKKCQPQILDYAIEAVQETPDSLSDERSTSKDDSDAKYYRVLGAGLSLVLGLLQRLDVSDMQSSHESYNSFFSLDPVWNSSKSGDAFVRRQCCQLLWLSLEKQQTTLANHIPKIAKTLVSEALKSDQSGSALELVKVLTRLTKRHPEIWGVKKPPLMRLRPFLEKGSQGSPSPTSFWAALDQLIQVMPKGNLSAEVVADLLRSLRIGVSGRDEPRVAAVDAWSCYLSVCQRLLAATEPSVSRSEIVIEFVHPVVEQYLHPPKERPILGVEAQQKISAKALQMLSSLPDESVINSVKNFWTRTAQGLGARLLGSLAEAPEDFSQAQQALADEGGRFFSILAALQDTDTETDAKANRSQAVQLVFPAALELLEVALESLHKDAYRPFAAASILEAAFVKTPFLFGEEALELVDRLLPIGSQTRMETLLSSTSAPYLLSCVTSLCRIPMASTKFEQYWMATVKALLEHTDEQLASKYITQLVAHASAGPLAHEYGKLQEYLTDSCVACARSEKDAWELFETCFTFDVLTSDMAKTTTRKILTLFNNSSGPPTKNVLRAMDVIAVRKPALLSHDEDVHLALLTRLLALAEDPDEELSTRAAALRLQLESHSSTDGGPRLVRIVQENLETAGPASLAIDTLVQQATTMSAQLNASAEQLFPSTTVWYGELAVFFQGNLNPLLSLTNNLGGVYFLAAANQTQESKPPQRDRKGLAVPARMALYTSRLLSAGFMIDLLPVEFQVELTCLLYLSALLVSDQITLLDEGKMWASLTDPEDLSDAEEFVSSTRTILNQILVNVGQGDGVEAPHLVGLSGSLIKLLLTQSQTLSPLAVYSARALYEHLQAVAEKHVLKTAQLDEWISSLDILKATPTTVLPCAAIILGCGELLSSSRSINTLLNRLISDVAGASADSLKTLLTLILLNACLPIYGDESAPVANNRLVFAVKQITSWFDIPETVGSKMAAESCRALTRLFPYIKEVYGSYWEKTLEFCKHLWTRAAREEEEKRLPYIHASLKLVSTLETIPEPNDDLEDAIQAFSTDKTRCLVGILGLQEHTTSQPAEIVNSLLFRQVDSLPPVDISELEDVYGLVGCPSRDIQNAAFTLLHRAIPRAQEKLSVDIVLEKANVHLPDELLSLLLEAPTLEKFHDQLLVGFPTPVRSYFLAWHLVFDAFSTASFPLRTAYTEDLKASNLIGPMLGFIFDALGHSVARPINLEKAHLTDVSSPYDIKVAESEPEERAMQWLLVHVYFLTLKYLPGLVKGWYINCRSKQTRIAVESWTTRYFSPIIISQTLDDVSKWADEQEPPAEDEKELIIKISKLSREVIVGYEVDELQASIAIRLPPAYPLDSVSVVSVNRVAVNEKKWQSWLMTTQGVITFSNGSIVDGIATFRRNVIGAMKGQTECAICYSIISTDKRVPDKRCGTCKNLFHRGCLYQWFQTSNQNTCPLCRNPIDYLGAPSRRDPSWVE